MTRASSRVSTTWDDPIAEGPFAKPLITRLDDGTRILVRGVADSDASALQTWFAALSDTSRAFRFLRPYPELSADDVHLFTHPDHVSHEAIGALDVTCDLPRPAAVARHFRLASDPTSAEIALTVVDAYQGRGLGTLLLGLLAQIAADAGIRSFLALVGRDNHVMIRLLRDLGGWSGTRGSGDQEIILPVHRDPAAYPETAAGAAFRRAYALRRPTPPIGGSGRLTPSGAADKRGK